MTPPNLILKSLNQPVNILPRFAFFWTLNIVQMAMDMFRKSRFRELNPKTRLAKRISKRHENENNNGDALHCLHSHGSAGGRCIGTSGLCIPRPLSWAACNCSVRNGNNPQPHRREWVRVSVDGERANWHIHHDDRRVKQH
jgi:hypothetical protein